MDFSLSLPSANSQFIKFDTSLFEMESQLETTQPNNTCISISNNNNRRETISFILQLSHKFDPMLSYLAIDYLHRFISTQPILTQVLVYIIIYLVDLFLSAPTVLKSWFRN